MTREELIEKMCDAHWNSVYEFGCWSKATEEIKQDSYKGMAAALDVAVWELLGEPNRTELDENNGGSNWPYGVAVSLLNSRRSRYLKPKSDPAVDEVTQLIECWNAHRDKHHVAELIVAAVRNADKGASNGR